MFITPQTKISELVKANKDSIEAIASLSKPLEKLKNPLLRKLMASRVTIAEAAKMGGCSIEEFRLVLKPLGFEFGEENTAETEVEGEKPDWLQQLPAEKIVNFDVRPILAGGSDPLKEIMQRFKQLPEGQALCIINTFVPVPLVRLLEKDGTLSYTETISGNEFHTYFLKKEKAVKPETIPPKEEEGPVVMADKETFERVWSSYPKEKIQEIDVRHLEMPGPMQAILEALESLPDENALYIFHKRVPVYLLEELADKNYRIYILTLSETEVRMLIFKRIRNGGYQYR